MIIARRFLEIMYKSEENITVRSVFFADDNIAPLQLKNAEDISPLLNIYNRHTIAGHQRINPWMAVPDWPRCRNTNTGIDVVS